ncbi:MAG: transposase [Akkermansiaceae bacterium]|nr:transposase [Akkermansiaceae bacterium]
MASQQQLNTGFSRVFFDDIVNLYPRSQRQYACTGISDIHYCQLGVLRCLSSSTTGQEFLQYHADQNVAHIEPSHFFKALQSERRLGNITSLNDLLATPMTEHVADPYAQCRELDDWDVYAVDGHYHKAACFDPKHLASDGTLRATATGHFFRMNMRTHHLSCLAMAEPKDGKKREHDMAAIKRSTVEALRNGAGVGRKVMLIWDKACIDYRHWFKLKHTYGIYFTTCEKSNSAAEICSVNMLDRSEPRNAGVVSDHMVGTSNGVQLRRIVYINPEDGVTYTYLTNDVTLPAYLIVLLYKHRWDIEKIFDELKNKMNERKSWGSSKETKKSHAIFECLTHNLLLLCEKHIEKTEGIRDEVEEKKQVGRIKAAPRIIVQAVRNFINSALTRATQRTQRFIRWVRVRLYIDAPWSESMARLRELWTLPTR